MATLPTTYSIGTASVAVGSTTVTVSGTVLTGIVFAGDMFADPAQPLVPPQRVATDAVGNTFELWTGWPGAAMTEDPYEVRITPDTARMQERTRQVLELLSRVSNTGIGIDAVGNFAERSDYDAEAEGFSFLSLDGAGGGNTPLIYVRDTATTGVWSDPVTIVGPEGPGGLAVALSDEVTTITAGQKMSLRQLGAATIDSIRASLNTASSSGPVTVDVKKNGVSIFTTKLTIDQGETTSKTAASPYVLATTALADDDLLTFHVDTSGVGATGLKVLIKQTTA